MANCVVCGTKLGFLNKGEAGRCAQCDQNLFAERKADEAKKREIEAATEQARIDAVMATTETGAGLNVLTRIRVVMVSIDTSFDAKLVESHSSLMRLLKQEALACGGNAVIGVTINAIETGAASLGSAQFKKFKLFAYGTAVALEAV